MLCYKTKPNDYSEIEISKVYDCSRGQPEAPFSISTTLRCRGGCYSFPWITPLYP